MHSFSRIDSGKQKSYILWSIILVAFLLPSFLRVVIENGHPTMECSLPYIISGDEPHYLVMVNSLIKDGDLAVNNNYKTVWASGGSDAGKRFRHVLLDKHMAGPSQPWHWPGMPMFLAGLVWPLADTPYVEPACIFINIIIGLIGLVAVSKCIHIINPKNAWFTILIIALATPLWHYSARMFTEVYLFTLLAWAIYFGFAGHRWGLSGILLSAGVLFHQAFAITGASIGLCLVLKKDFRAVIKYGVPFIICIILYILYNYWLFGEFGTSPRASQISELSFKNIPFGATGLLFESTHGLLIFSPVLILSFLGITTWFKKKLWAFLMIPAMVNYLFFAGFIQWHGGFCYATRFLVPTLALIAIPLHLFVCRIANQKTSLKIIAGSLLVISIFINGQASFIPIEAFSRTPWSLIYQKESDYIRSIQFSAKDLSSGLGEMSQNNILQSNKNKKQGFLGTTSDLRMAAGNYEARFTIKCTNTTKRPYAILTVSDQFGTNTLNSIMLHENTTGYEEIAVPFTINGKFASNFFPYRKAPNDIRLGVFVTGAAAVALKEISIKK